MSGFGASLRAPARRADWKPVGRAGYTLKVQTLIAQDSHCD